MSDEVLVFGRDGQVARALARAPKARGLRPVFAGRERLDLAREDPGPLIAALRPAGVVNAAAYTAVDRAENERDAAFQLNATAAGMMARACAAADIPFVHISSDYVFDGTKSGPYVEDDPIAPVNVYGASKAAGEAEVMAAGGRWTILRTAWVIGPQGRNFINTMRGLAAERDEVSVVEDQIGRPTLAEDVAAVALEAIARNRGGDGALLGLFHLAGADDAAWADVAEVVFETLRARTGRRPALRRVTTAEFPRPARRPANSRLDTARLQAAAGWRPRPWREAVAFCLERTEPAEARP